MTFFICRMKSHSVWSDLCYLLQQASLFSQ
jgi:hypothetical protein